MLTMQNPSWISTLIITFAICFVIFYWFYVLHINQAKKASLLSSVGASIGITIVLYNIYNLISPYGIILLGISLLLPSLLVWYSRKHLAYLDQRKLIGFQIFRFMGALFLLEMSRGNIPSTFAVSAGTGDIIVAFCALILVLAYSKIPRTGIIFLNAIGIADFIIAIFFGFTSLPGPLQIFATGFNNQTLLFPLGMIPFFMVPIALAFHILSLINLDVKK